MNRLNGIAEKYHRIECVTFIGSDVSINNNVFIYNDAKINTGAVIKPNSMITKDVPPYAIVERDNKIVGYRYSDEIISDLLNLKWWNLDLPQMTQQGIKIPTKNIQDFIKFLQDLDPKDKIYLKSNWFKFSQDPTNNNTSLQLSSAKEASAFMPDIYLNSL